MRLFDTYFLFFIFTWMKTPYIKIRLCQLNFWVGNFEYNYLKIKESIEKAKKEEVDIIVFPELAITGYHPEDLLFKKQFIKDNIKYLNKIKQLSRNIIIITGFVHEEKKKLFNALAFIYDKEIIDIYHKINLPNYSVFDEKRYFEPGDKISIYGINGYNFGVSICEDIWADKPPVELQKKYGDINFLININASPYYIEKINERLKLIKRIAKRNRIHVLYLNTVGGQDEIVFDGGTLVVDDKGSLIAAGKQFEEDEIDVFIPLKRKKRVTSKKVSYINIEYKLKEGERNIKGKGIKAKFMKTEEEILSALTLGTRDYIKKNGFKKVVIGLSGGIDSALTTVIAVRAIGKENVLTVFMPSMFTSDESYRDAKQLADNLGVEFIILPIKEIFEKYIEVLKPVFKDLPFDIAEENIQARIRGNLLMAISNKFGYLVLTTGNKSETSTGYATLYGDMAGGFAVIKDLLKTWVYKIAEYINQKEGYDLIPKNILTKAPTAELRENQKDSDTLPEYELLDKILYYYIERNESYKEVVKHGFKPEIVKKVIRMIDRSEYKRRQAPPGIKITKLAFGKDRRMPITNGYKIN